MLMAESKWEIDIWQEFTSEGAEPVTGGMDAMPVRGGGLLMLV